MGVRRPRLNWDSLRNYGPALAILVLFVTLSFSSNVFLHTTNLLNILEQWAPVGIMALGGTFVLIAGGFDLSIGAMYVLAAILAAKVMNATNVPLGILAGLGVGAGLGLINGLLGTVGRMNVFVATLGTSIVYGGFATAITSGSIVVINKQGFGFLATDSFLGVNIAIWILLACGVLSAFLLARTVLGRGIFAVGGNIDAARLAGVRIHLTRIVAFTLSGLAGGIAGLLVASQSLSADANNYTTTAFNVWTALLIGGNSMLGGEGAVWRTLVGVALLALIGNGFDLLSLNPLYQQVVTGAILLGAIGLDAWGRYKRH
jgi:ribose transport system permease protein